MGVVKLFRSLTPSGLWLSSNDKLNDYYLSSWQPGESALPMLILRVFLAASATAIMVFTLIQSRADPHWLVYLTNWGLIMILATTVSGVVVSAISYSKKSPETNGTEPLPWYVQLYWLFYNITVPLAIVITALFWILLYDPALYKSADSPAVGAAGLAFWLDIMTHGANSCLVLIEFLASRTPLRLLHFYQPLGFGLWYAAFSVIYYAAGGTVGDHHYIYEILDWERPQRAGAVVAAATGGILLIYFVLWTFTICRDRISICLVRTTSKEIFTWADQHHVNLGIV